jgi:hypothetical protein
MLELRKFKRRTITAFILAGAQTEGLKSLSQAGTAHAQTEGIKIFSSSLTCACTGNKELLIKLDLRMRKLRE